MTKLIKGSKIRRCLGQLGVAAAEIGQRLAFRGPHGLDLADEYGVVAARIKVHYAALYKGKRPGEDRTARGAGYVADPVKAIRVLGRKAARDQLLVLCQHVDGKKTAFFQVVVDRSSLLYAYQDEGGIEREGRKGADGDAPQMAVIARGGHDRDSAGKMAQRRSKFILADRH